MSKSQLAWDQLLLSLDASVASEASVAAAGSASVAEARVDCGSKAASKTEAVVQTETESAAPEEAEDAEPEVYTVTSLNRQIRQLLEGDFPLLWLRAEISNFKAHSSGHFYFSLKDAKSQINAVMFRGYNSHLRFRPEDGMEVLIRGKVTVYEPRGNYQIFCEQMEPVGLGALQKAFEQLKAKLAAEGLFDVDRKRALPAWPRHIAIVTSPTGAAIRDMLNVLGRRFKGLEITIVPCKVQGVEAAGEIVRAIDLANRLSTVDVMIVGRGGGSIEDLWPFNEERVARAIASARVPVISAVGHEVDFTIADFVADLRAPTPSAAAELVVKNAADWVERIRVLTRTLKLATLQNMQSARTLTSTLARRLIDPQRAIQDAVLRNDELSARLIHEMRRGLERRSLAIEILSGRLVSPLAVMARNREVINGLRGRVRAAAKAKFVARQSSLLRATALLESLSPLRVLVRGYSLVMKQDAPVVRASELNAGDMITIRMSDGVVGATVASVASASKNKQN